jgi:hypothetical protein
MLLLLLRKCLNSCIDVSPSFGWACCMDRYRNLAESGRGWSIVQTQCASPPCPTSVTIEHLPSGELFEFRVAGVNINGVGAFTPPSLHKEVRTLDPTAPVPGSPEPVVVIDTKFFNIRLKWDQTAVTAKQGQALGYRIRCVVFVMPFTLHASLMSTRSLSLPASFPLSLSPSLSPSFSLSIFLSLCVCTCVGVFLPLLLPQLQACCVR